MIMMHKNLHPSPATVEVAVPSDTTSVSNKQAKDIQTGIKVSSDNKVTGTSNYVKDIENAGGEGNYLVLEFPQAKNTKNKVVCSYESGSPTTLSSTDYQYLIKLKEKKPVTITITGEVEATRTLDLTGITLSPAE